MKKRRASGEADEEEAWPLTNLEHTVLMYDLMMKQVIENLDPLNRAVMDRIDRQALEAWWTASLIL